MWEAVRSSISPRSPGAGSASAMRPAQVSRTVPASGVHSVSCTATTLQCVSVWSGAANAVHRLLSMAANVGTA
jgi:hypothetical protein